MPATIRDVARVAGCSIKTVSRVINGEPYVTQETQARVQAAIRAVGYAPNISAKRLAENRSYMICILMYPGFYQPASEMFTRIMDIGYDENYDILIQPYFPPHTRSRRKLVSLIYEHRIDGFVTTPPCDADDFVADLLTTYKVPQVQINPFTRTEQIPYVAGEDMQGAQAMTDYLLSMGHRRIGFMRGPGNMRASMDRLLGYKKSLEKHRVEVDENYLRDSEWTFDGGYTQTKLLMELSQPPTAIFAGSDEAAFGVIFAAQEMGLSIPDQLSVSGFGDVSLSRHIWPGLSTVHQPTEKIVEIATRLLIDMLKGKSTEQKNIVIPSQLLLRGSIRHI